MIKKLLERISTFFKGERQFFLIDSDGWLFDGHLSYCSCGWTQDPSKAKMFWFKEDAKKMAAEINMMFGTCKCRVFPIPVMKYLLTVKK